MRIRAGVVLIEDNKVALIERHRAGLEYFVFPGGGVDEGETVEQAAVREAREERGAGEFGTGTGEEFIDSDPNDPSEGIYVPIWMPIEELSQRGNIYPAELVEVVVRSMREGWGV